jgi:hypothetical protein
MRESRVFGLVKTDFQEKPELPQSGVQAPQFFIIPPSTQFSYLVSSFVVCLRDLAPFQRERRGAWLQQTKEPFGIQRGMSPES